jgi:hypothetical protein
MKRFLILVPIILLFLINSCGVSQDQIINAINQTRTAEAATLTATNLPLPTLTPSANGQWLITTLNTDSVGSDYAGSWSWDQRAVAGNDAGLAVNLDQLEDSIGADLTITGVDFPFLADKVSRAFLIQARCECAVSSDCCSPQHMFVLTVRRLYLAIQKSQQYQPYPETSYLTTAVVPAPIQELQVECYDHQVKIATMIAPWSAVLDFYHGQINGYQLGQQVRRQ